MALLASQRLERLQVWIDEIGCWRERETTTISDWTADGTRLSIGDAWPHSSGLLTFETNVRIPNHWPLDQTWIYLDLGGESLLHFKAKTSHETWGLDPVHRTFRAPAHQFAITAEAIARLPFGEPVHDPRLNAAHAFWREDAVHAFHLRLTQIVETVTVLEEHAVVPHLLEAAEAAVRALDWPSATEEYLSRIHHLPEQKAIWASPPRHAVPAPLSDVQVARVAEVNDTLCARLRDLQARFPPEGQLAVSGHAHIDLVWLWPYAETRRKLRRSFSTTCNLLDAHPGFVFNQSTAAYYHQLETDDPDLLARIREAGARGQWEPVGGMWVEADCVMPAGESLVRQLLYGQRYFEAMFGKTHDTAWLPDCFGFTGALPQILRQAGITRFFTTKLNWSETNRFPHDIFLWEGIDGSRLLAHSFNNPVMSYNGTVEPEVLVGTWQNFDGKVRHDESLVTIGYGDGGGGPSPEMLERWEQLEDFPTLPRLRASRVDAFFDRLEAAIDRDKLPVWLGEKYLELHRGTLTTQGRIKRLNRQAEAALISTEVVTGLAHLLGASRPKSLEPIWRVLLKNQFHDILPGSSIAEGNAEAEEELAQTIAAAEEAQAASLAELQDLLPQAKTDALLVVNPSLDHRPLNIEVDGAPFATGNLLAPLSVTVIDRATLRPSGSLEISSRSLENEHLRVAVGEDGSLTSLFHKASGREALAGRGNQLWAYPMDKPRHYDAWDIDADIEMSGIEITEVEAIAVTERCPHRVTLRITRRFGNSTITQHLRLWAGGRALEIVTDLDWHDRRVLLRSRTPVNARAERASYETAFGAVERTTHHNTSWDRARFEVPAHRFADLSEPGFGVAILNDGRYGHSISGNVLGLTLLRSPVFPDPLADEGPHRFTYALMPHEGDWRTSGVREAAHALNTPLPFLPTTNLATGVYAPLRVKGLASSLAALKPAEDGDGLILRLYEPNGARGAITVTPAPGWALSSPISLLEVPLETAPSLTPFQIRSWRIYNP